MIPGRKEINDEVISTFLAGHDPMERIVNLEYKYNEDKIKVIYRDENDNKCEMMDFFHPFCWATRSACDKLCGGDRARLRDLMAQYGIKVKKLDTRDTTGRERSEYENGYLFMFYTIQAMSYKKFLEFFQKAENPIYSKEVDEGSKKRSKQYLIVTPQEQYMIATGKRFFKGYDDYNELLRLIFDLETEGLDPTRHRIIEVGIRFNRPIPTKTGLREYQQIFKLKGFTEEEKNAYELELIKVMLKMIQVFKPDIITAHNGENFDWWFIMERCKALGTTIEELSQTFFNGNPVRKNNRETILKLGGEIETFYQTIVPGTVITDSLHAVRRAQALDSNMERADLKYVTKYSKIVKPNRVYMPGDKIAIVSTDLEKHYAYNDVDGDWYLYDPNFNETVNKKKELEYDLEYFIKKVENERREPTRDEWCEINAEGLSVTWEEYVAEVEEENNSLSSPEELYTDYLNSFNEEQKATSRFVKGMGPKGFTMYTRNYIADGYELVTGEFIGNRYLLDDLWECDKVEHRYNGSNFLICKMLPVPFQKCCTMGTAGQWKSIMLAWSYENNLAVPMFGESKSFTGGLSRLLKVGFIDNVAKFDYNSLYPSITLTWDISDPEKDLMGAMLFFLEYVLLQREKYKGLMKKAGKLKDKLEGQLSDFTGTEAERLQLIDDIRKAAEDKSANDKKQLPLKILGNSFFGSYGAPNVFPFGSLVCAERITCTGRMCLRLMISHFNKLGYAPIVGDSFTGDTPLFIKYYDTGLIDIKPIDEIIDENSIETDELGREYDYSQKPYMVLCRSGWCDCKYVYRHRTEKDIYRVYNDNDMIVDVTEDHSLYNDKQEEIKPSQITQNTELEYFNGEIKGLEQEYPYHVIHSLTLEVAIGIRDRFPVELLNTTPYCSSLVIDCWKEMHNPNKEYSKTILAQLMFIENQAK
jgi:hypothetical protein